jgi:calcineurin-like phosphoesterase family protein
MNWFTSDTHFNSSSMKKLKRPFSSVEEMNAHLIDRWNSVVKPDDYVFHLGDVFEYGCFDSDILEMLNGNKVLVMGNHDDLTPETYSSYFAHVFEESAFGRIDVDPANGWTQIPIELSHRPMKSEMMMSETMLNFHGDIHKKWKINGPHINVGVDVWDYQPVSEEDLAALALGILNQNGPLDS